MWCSRIRQYGIAHNEMETVHRFRYIEGGFRYSASDFGTFWFNLDLTRSPLGGGADSAPVPDFLDSSKTVADIDAKLLLLSPASFWRLSPRFQKSLSRNFRENSVLVSHVSQFGVKKNGECLKAVRIFSFKVWRNRKTPNGRKIELSTKQSSRIFDVFHFWPLKLKISIFQK